MTANPISPFSSAASYDPSCYQSNVAGSALLEDQLLALLHLERSYQVDQIPCRKSTKREDRLPHEDWRRKICEWSYRVVDHFRIDREVVSVAMNFFDRFLSMHNTQEPEACPCPSCQRAVDSQTFQLAAMTSLYLAIKLHAESCGPESLDSEERRPRRKKLKLTSFVDLSRGQFSAEDICSMERRMLATLNWKVHPTTPSSVVSFLLRLMPSHTAVPYVCRCHYDLVLHVLNELARYLSELSICMANVSCEYRPSEVAFAAILVSMQMLTPTALPVEVRDDFCESISQISTLYATNERNLYLMSRLKQCFWPEMLLDECEVEHDHPISLAKAAGLLDMGILYQGKLGRTGSADSFTDVTQQPMEETPVCISP